MGDTYLTGMGYGITFERSDDLAEAIEEAVDIEFLLQDNYPLLRDCHAGNAWSKNVTNMILIDSTVYHDYSFLIEADTLQTSIPKEGMDELRYFCEKFNLSFNPGWKIFSYVG